MVEVTLNVIEVENLATVPTPTEPAQLSEAEKLLNWVAGIS